MLHILTQCYAVLCYMVMNILAQLIDILFPPRSDEMLIRDTDIHHVAEQIEPTLITACAAPVTALFSFKDPLVRALIHEAKYHGSVRAFNILGEALHDYLCEWTDEEGFSAGNCTIIPIPLSEKRKRERGYNQVEKVLTRGTRDLSITICTDLLVRMRDTVSQTTLSRNARKENMHGAFSTTRIPLRHHTYILLDDVLTTGATIQAAIDTLKRSGATRVVPLALAH